MRLPGREALRALLENPEDVMVSIYLPTQRTGDVEQGAIRFRNLLRQAEEQLMVQGLRQPDAARLLDRARTLLDDTLFWHHQGDGLAVFLSERTFTYYRLPYRLEEMVVVAARFHLSPLLPLFTADGGFYVLGLSQNRVRLLQCSREGAREITPDSLPSSLADVLQYDEVSKNLQFRSGPPQGGPGRGTAMYHGHGEGKDVAKDNLVRFLREVDHGMRQALTQEEAPLVLAGVGYLRALYAEVNTYAHLLPEGIDGNPDTLGVSELHGRAWPLVAEHFAREREAAVARYHEAAARGLATNRLEDVVLAAHDGRVAVVFAALGVHRWGECDFERRRVVVHEAFEPGDEDLVDIAVVQSLLRGASAYVAPPADVPDGGPVAALLRY